MTNVDNGYIGSDKLEKQVGPQNDKDKDAHGDLHDKRDEVVAEAKADGIDLDVSAISVSALREQEETYAGTGIPKPQADEDDGKGLTTTKSVQRRG